MRTEFPYVTIGTTNSFHKAVTTLNRLKCPLHISRPQGRSVPLKMRTASPYATRETATGFHKAVTTSNRLKAQFDTEVHVHCCPRHLVAPQPRLAVWP